MLRVTELHHRGDWPEADRVDCVQLDHIVRQKRRLRVAGEAGTDIMIDLPRQGMMADGDGLLLESGAWVRVVAAPEKVAIATCSDSLHLARLAWHLGNRHTAAELHGDSLVIAYDSVLVEMLKLQGASVVIEMRPFHPESGAYHEAHSH